MSRIAVPFVQARRNRPAAGHGTPVVRPREHYPAGTPFRSFGNCSGLQDEGRPAAAKPPDSGMAPYLRFAGRPRLKPAGRHRQPLFAGPAHLPDVSIFRACQDGNGGHYIMRWPKHWSRRKIRTFARRTSLETKEPRMTSRTFSPSRLTVIGRIALAISGCTQAQPLT